MDYLFHIYVGKSYQGPMRAKNAGHACQRYAKKTGKPAIIYSAMPAVSVRELKAPRHDSP